MPKTSPSSHEVTWSRCHLRNNEGGEHKGFSRGIKTPHCKPQPAPGPQSGLSLEGRGFFQANLGCPRMPAASRLLYLHKHGGQGYLGALPARPEPGQGCGCRDITSHPKLQLRVPATQTGTAVQPRQPRPGRRATGRLGQPQRDAEIPLQHRDVPRATML